MKRKEIRIAGFGGQGVILAGLTLGRAAALYDNKYAVVSQSFGPEARGGACAAEVVITEEPVDFPRVTEPSALVVMSQEAYARFSPELAKDGTLITEEELVIPQNLRRDIKHFSIPATRIAEELGKRIVLNIVMMGFMTAVTKLLDPEAMRKAVTASVPKGTEDLNLRAFERGYEYGMTMVDTQVSPSFPTETLARPI